MAERPRQEKTNGVRIPHATGPLRALGESGAGMSPEVKSGVESRVLLVGRMAGILMETLGRMSLQEGGEAKRDGITQGALAMENHPRMFYGHRDMRVGEEGKPSRLPCVGLEFDNGSKVTCIVTPFDAHQWVVNLIIVDGGAGLIESGLTVPGIDGINVPLGAGRSKSIISLRWNGRNLAGVAVDVFVDARQLFKGKMEDNGQLVSWVKKSRQESWLETEVYLHDRNTSGKDLPGLIAYALWDLVGYASLVVEGERRKLASGSERSVLRRLKSR